jgi:hypothetical protein
MRLTVTNQFWTMKLYIFAVLSIFCLRCQSAALQADKQVQKENKSKTDTTGKYKSVAQFDSSFKTIHVFVTLCDNQYQGIVPVPPKIGNGQDPARNLYWGCGFGVKTFFKNSRDWKLIASSAPDSIRLERLIFRHKTKNYYLVADAYDGRYIRQAITDFMASASGKLKDTVTADHTLLGIDGNASLIAYVGHDGLMEFQLQDSFFNADGKKRDCIILACSSRDFFGPYLKNTKATPLVWTANLMCPEAYTLHDAIEGYVLNENAEQIRSRAAKAYSKYQKTDENFSRALLVTGWE